MHGPFGRRPKADEAKAEGTPGSRGGKARGPRLVRRLVHALPLALITIALVVAGVGLRAADPGIMAQLRNIAFDEFQRLHPRPYDPDVPVRVVAIDEASLDRLGQWPWSRLVIADLVQRLADLGAAAVALDFVMAEWDRSSPEQIARLLPDGPEVEALRDRLLETPRNDFRLAETLQRTPSVLGLALGDTPDDAAVTARPSLGPHPPMSEPLVVPAEDVAGRAFLEARAGFAFAGDDPRPFLPDYTAVTAPLPVLTQAAAGLGAMNWTADRDQIVRAVPLVFTLDGAFVPSLAAEALRVAQGADTYVVRASNASGAEAFGEESGVNAVRIGAFTVETDPASAVRIHYRATRPDQYIPAWRVLAGEVAPEEVAGRIVLVGATAAGLLDLRSTPIDVTVPGVEIHAQLLEHIVEGARLARPDWTTGLEVVLFVGLAVLFAVAAATLSPIGSLGVGVLALAATLAGCYLAFTDRDILIDPSFPILASTLVLVATTGYAAVREEAQRRSVRRAFSRYVAPELVEELAQNPDRLALGGELRDMTILFTDMRGFTTISEGMDAVELTGFINAFLTPLTDTILSHRGTIDKYMGDAIMAFWNAPLDDPDHASNACEAALAMLVALKAFNAEHAGTWPPVDIGIGINTGTSCVGNLGSLRRFDYSVIGDDVNVASRLEGQTKNYGLPVVVGERTRAAATGHRFVAIDRVQVKGRDRPLDVFALTGGPNHPVDPEVERGAPLLEALVEAYRAGDLPAARAGLAALEAAQTPAFATLAAIYRDRLAALGDGPLPEGWDGTERLTSK